MEWVSHQREGMLHAQLLHNVHLVDFAPPSLTLRLAPEAPDAFPRQLELLLEKGTGQPWTIAISEEIGHTTLHKKAQVLREERQALVLEMPPVKLLLAAFPGSTVTFHENT